MQIENSCTSQIQQWHKPRQGKEIENVSLNEWKGIPSTLRIFHDEKKTFLFNYLQNAGLSCAALRERNVNIPAFFNDHNVYDKNSTQLYGLNEINKVSKKDIRQIEAKTRLHNKLWLETRSSRLSASICGNVLRTVNTGNFASGFLKSHILQVDIKSEAIRWGLVNESVAITEYEEFFGDKVEKCGLFIDTIHNWLAATPDGLIRHQNKIIEVKCPYSLRNDLPLNAIFLDKDGLNKRHSYYAQVQIQMHVTRMRKADFIIWTPKGLHVESVQYDENFILDALPKLKTYYEKIFSEMFFKLKYKN